MANYYELLNLQPTATVAEIKEAYLRERARLAGESDDNKPQEQLKELDTAYAVLVDPNQRAAYDRTLNIGAQSQALVLTQTPLPATVVTPQVPTPQQACPHCGALNPIKATICAECGKQISRPCPQCGQQVIMGQTVCSRCNTFIPEYDQQRFADAIATEQQVQQERREAQSRYDTMLAADHARINFGIIFWGVALFLCMALMLFAVVLMYNWAR
jgi:ribosomal protein L40E